MEFRPIAEPPEGYSPVLVQRSLSKEILKNVTERRSEYLVTLWTGQNFLNEEPHWEGWAAIPPESGKEWMDARLILPNVEVPVLVVIPSQVNLVTTSIEAGLQFGYFHQDLEGRTWRIHQRVRGARYQDGDTQTTCWLSVSLSKVSSWMPLPPMNLRLRACL